MNTNDEHRNANLHLSEGTLNDLVDGALTHAQRQAAESHLGSCGECREAVSELRAIVDGAGRLSGVTPSRDLMPVIRRRIAPRASFRLWAAAAAAAVLLAVVLIGGRSWQDGSGTGTPMADPVAGTDPLRAELREAEKAFREATEALLKAVEKQRNNLPEEAADALATDLEAIDRAIDDMRARLNEDPAAATDGRVYTALQQQRMRLLWRVARLSS